MLLPPPPPPPPVLLLLPQLAVEALERGGEVPRPPHFWLPLLPGV